MKKIFFNITMLAALCLVLYGCNSSTFLPQEPSTTKKSVMEIKGFEAFVTQEGEPQYILKADQAQVKEEQNLVAMNHIHLTFYKEEEKQESGILVADKGQYYFRENPAKKRHRNDIDLKGNVLFKTSDGTILKTPEVHYQSKDEKIYSKAGFEKRRVTKDQVMIIKGKTFETDINMTHWKDTGAEITFETRSQENEKE